MSSSDAEANPQHDIPQNSDIQQSKLPKPFVTDVEGTPHAEYLKYLNLLRNYELGEAIEELRQVPQEKKPKYIVLALWGATGVGKSTLINFLRRVTKDREMYLEDSPVSATASQGAFSLMQFSLTEKSIIYDTRGSNSLPSKAKNEEFVNEILLQIAATKGLGYTKRSHEDEEEEFSELSILPFEVALDFKPEPIHIPILCVPITADRAHRKAINKVILKLRRRNVFPVVAITKFDLLKSVEEFSGKDEIEIRKEFAEHLGLSIDDIFIFKCYRSEDEPRDFQEETKAVKNIHKLFHKAERNMIYKPAVVLDESKTKPSPNLKSTIEEPSLLAKIIQFLFWVLVVFVVILAIAAKKG